MRALIIIAVIIGVTMTVATIVVGSRTFEGTVAKDAYMEGLQWDAARRARQESGWKAALVSSRLPTGRSDLQVRLLDRNGRPLLGASVVIDISRPETSRYDRSYVADEVGSGLFSAAVDLPRFGRWQLRTTVTQGARTVVFHDSLSVTIDR